MRRQTTLLELDSNVSALVERQLFSLVERTSIQMSLRDTVKSMFTSFPALKAVYLYSRDGTLLMFGPSTVRSFDAWPQWELPGRVAKETASAVRFYGAVEQQGMPQPFYSHDDAPPLLLAGVRVKGGALLLGFSARVLEEHYAALAQTAQGGVYLRTARGACSPAATRPRWARSMSRRRKAACAAIAGRWARTTWRSSTGCIPAAIPRKCAA